MSRERAGRGEFDAALDAASEAVALSRQIASVDAGSAPVLAWSLGQLSVRLTELGRHRDALAMAEEGCGLYRQLARDQSTDETAGLALLLRTVAMAQSKVGRLEDAVAAAQEAVDILRTLAADDPTHLPSLADGLDTLGNELTDVGQHGDDLARTLHDHSIDLNEQGRADEALAAMTEAVALLRVLAIEQPRTRLILIPALQNLANQLADLGRDDEAQATIDEAERLATDPQP